MADLKMVEGEHSQLIELAYASACQMADDATLVGDCVGVEVQDHLYEARFTCLRKGYEGWQWIVSMFYDEQAAKFTLNETSIIPTDQALLAPPWVPWKDRLLPSDLRVDDSIGTAEDDERMEPGYMDPASAEHTQDDAGQAHQGSELRHEDEHSVQDRAAEAESSNADTTNVDSLGEGNTQEQQHSQEHQNAEADQHTQENQKTQVDPSTQEDQGTRASQDGQASQDSQDSQDSKDDSDPAASPEDQDAQVREVVEDLHLGRRHVLTEQARHEIAQRWYQGPHGRKALSTRVSLGNQCVSCAFFIPLAGQLGTMFGACANYWSPDDGKVVAVDHGCGQHSEIEPPEPSSLWIQSKPAFDNLHIDVVKQSNRDEMGAVELIEEVVSERRSRRKR